MSFELIKDKEIESNFIKETTDAGFEDDVLRQSLNQPVLVAFYSSFNASCNKFIEMLSKHIISTNGKLLMVKVNIDKCPVVTNALQIENIPTTYVFAGGQVIDGFAGMMPENEIKLLIEKLATASTPQVVEEKQGLNVEEITKIMTSADDKFFDELYREALEKYSLLLEDDENNMLAMAGLGWCLACQGDMESVGEIISNLTPEQLQANDRIKGLKFIIDITAIDDWDSLEQLVIKNPSDVNTQYNLAHAYIVAGEFEKAIDCLVNIIAKNRKWEDGKAHKFLVEFFNALGAGNAITKRGKRKLSTVLFA